MKTTKLIKGTISLVLIVCIILGSILCHTKISVKAEEINSCESTEPDIGLDLSIQIDSQKISNCEIIQDNVDEFIVMSHKADGSKIKSTITDTSIIKNYYTKENELIYTDSINLIHDNVSEDYLNTIENLQNNDEQKNITRGENDWALHGVIPIYEIFNFKHWYGLKKDGKEKLLYIGCDNTYIIKYSKLSSGKKAHCDEYVNRIKDSNVTVGLVEAALTVCLSGIIIKLAPLVAKYTPIILDLMSQGMSNKAIIEYVKKRILKEYGEKIAKEVAKKLSAAGGLAAVEEILSTNSFFENRNKLKEYYRMIRHYGTATEITPPDYIVA